MEKIDANFIEDILEKDVFNRNKKLINLITQLSHLDEQKWIAINGEWGSGKTVFVKELEYLVNNPDKYKLLCGKYNVEHSDLSLIDTFYFNSWENDALNLPVLYMIFQIAKKYSDSGKINKSSKISESLIFFSKMFSNGAIDFSIFNSSKNVLDEIYNAETVKDIFNTLISEILAEKNNKLIIIIDEMDRCKPNYAVEILETFKHFYNNDKIIFIFSVNIHQLANTVKKLYGQNYDGELYLTRFFDKTVSLNVYQKDKYVEQYLDFGITGGGIMPSMCEACIKYFDFSARTTAQFINLVKYNNNLLDGNKFDMFNKTPYYFSRFFILIIGLALQCARDSLYKEFIKGNYNDWDNIIESNDFAKRWMLSRGDLTIRKDDDTKEEINSFMYLKYIYEALFKFDNYYNIFEYDEKKKLLLAFDE